jgi:tetratricopeptide (TPR) repeat protein|tara:strand:- start:2092 stop:2607 length:516 start_codon:yes stop_codon:yes gene_type:complete
MLKITKVVIFTAVVLLLSGCEEDKEQIAKMHFNQGFSYIGSLEAALTPKARKRLLNNAEQEFTQALIQNPNYFDALLNRGVVYVSQGKLNKAEKDYRLALDINPSEPSLNYNLACLYSLTGRLDLSIDALDMALENGFNNVERLRDDADLKNSRESEEFFVTLEKHKFFIR